MIELLNIKGESFMDIKRAGIYTILFALTIGIATQGYTNFGLDGLLVPLLFTFAYFTIIFIAATIIKNNSIVDIGWGFGFVVGSWLTLFVTESPTILSYEIVAFITIWGLRLSIRLFRRNWGKPEDFRYAQWRKEWGNKVVLTAFFRVFMIQGIINFIVGSASYVVIKYNQFVLGSPEQYFVYLALFISFVGLFFEVVGDEQLRQHISKRTKSLLQTGLWSVTRHPNYFGEILIWIGLYLSGITLFYTQSINIIYYALLVVSPVLMSVVLVKISTPLLEKNMEKYPGWEDYTKRVPMIFPWGSKSK
jgi:steroid 5-alpha reductase family enzyme